jgi:biopolymer transport protein ExbD
MARKRRKQSQGATLEMTPMIDVVFQLLIFFIVTLKEEDILAHLDISRPAPDPNTVPEEQIQDLLSIMVHKNGYVLQGKRVALSELDRQLSRLARMSSGVSVVIKCTGDSPHSYLMRLLDVCAKSNLTNISVFSM